MTLPCPSSTKRANGARVFIPLMVVLGACLLFPPPARSAPPAPPAKPAIVVFDFVGTGNTAKRNTYMGRKVAEMFRGHAFRRGQFETYGQAIFEEMMLEVGNPSITLKTPLNKVAALLKDSFDAQIGVWGEVCRVKGDTYKVHVKILDLRNKEKPLVVDETFDSTLHGIFHTVDKSLDKLMGIIRKPKYDPTKDNSYLKRPNLVKNGDFEKGTITPDNWERVDGLCTFYVDTPGRDGKCAMMDTYVLQDQYEEWQKKFAAGAKAADAPEPIRPKPPAYNTAGGTIGAHIYSDPIPIKQGVTYRVDFDYKARKGETKVFVKGYAPFYGKDGVIVHREVYRSQINLYPETKGKEWEHSVRIIHPTQPFILLTIRSEFDDNKTGNELRELLAKHLVKLGIKPMRDLKETREKIKGSEHVLTFKGSKYPVIQVVNNVFGRGTVAWAEIVQKDGKLEIQTRSMDIRKGTATKDWWNKRTISPEELVAESEKLARDIYVNLRPVIFLRVKLDAYWPNGNYWFDNVWITEEPPREEDDGLER
jgi:hypothetical protein